MHLAIGNRAMFHAPRHYEQLTRTEHHVAVAELNSQFTTDNKEQLVGVIVGVPHELAFELHDFDREDRSRLTAKSGVIRRRAQSVLTMSSGVGL